MLAWTCSWTNSWIVGVCDTMMLMLCHGNIITHGNSTFWISRIHRFTPLCRAFRNVASSTFSPKSDTSGLRPSSAAFLMTVATAGWMVSVISGMSMFCCRWSSPISSSAIFFSTDGAILSPSLQQQEADGLNYCHVEFMSTILKINLYFL